MVLLVGVLVSLLLLLLLQMEGLLMGMDRLLIVVLGYQTHINLATILPYSNS